MTLEELVRSRGAAIVNELYSLNLLPTDLTVNETRKEFDGEYSLVCFPLVRHSKKSPEETATEIGNKFIEQEEFHEFNVVKGFLNLNVNHLFLTSRVLELVQSDLLYDSNEKRRLILEYCGPNTNKPLHLGHLRNIFLGWSSIQILEALGHNVIKYNIYNDRGIAIAKTMVAWQREANGKTPDDVNRKGDFFVGDYYVRYAKILEEEVQDLIAKGISKEEAEKEAPIYKEAVDSLQKWEAGHKETLALWNTMMSWVHEGYKETYETLGISFDDASYESQTYLLGKNIVNEGLEKNVFFKKQDDSVWIDLTEDGLDEKLLLRGDGTSVYLTQDLGTADERFEKYKANEMVYVVANEQEYHFKVLKLCLQKLQKPYADGIFHLSYGMVNLPGGARMKSREGTTVDADDIVKSMIEEAKKNTEELGKIEDLSKDEAHKLHEMIGMAALKFFLLRVNPKKDIVFDPAESIDIHGFTGPFVQYSYARIASVLRAAKEDLTPTFNSIGVHSSEEVELVVHLDKFQNTVELASKAYDPSLIANYAYECAKIYNRFYSNNLILKAENKDVRNFRIHLSAHTSKVIEKAMALLGIKVPERM